MLEPILLRTTSELDGENLVTGPPDDEDGRSHHFRIYTPVLVDTIRTYKPLGKDDVGYILLMEGGRSGRFIHANTFTYRDWHPGDVGFIGSMDDKFESYRADGVLSEIEQLRHDFPGRTVINFDGFYAIDHFRSGNTVVKPTRGNLYNIVFSQISASSFREQIEEALRSPQ